MGAMPHPYTVRWLSPADAASVAAVEAKVHSREHHAGEEQIWAQLQETEVDGRNLSMGLYRGNRLVGFGIGFVMRDRREMSEFFEAPLPEGLDPTCKTIYVADYVVLPRHRKASRLIAAKYAHVVRNRDDLRILPMDGFSTSEYENKWRERAKFVGKLGWRMAGSLPYQDTKLGTTLYWLHFDRIPEYAQPPKIALDKPLEAATTVMDTRGDITVGCLALPAVWDALRPHWNELLNANAASPLLTWEYLRTWHVHFGLIETPCIIVALRAGRPVAVLPLEAKFKASMGRCIRHLVLPTETIHLRPFPLLYTDDAALQAVIDYLLARKDVWDGLELCLPAMQTALVAAMSVRLRKSGHLNLSHRGPVTHQISLDGDWPKFLHSRPPQLQTLLTQAETQMAQLGELHFEILALATSPETLHAYLQLEFSSPDDEAHLGAGTSAHQIAFYTELVEKYAKELGLFVGMLRVGDKPAAGIIGYRWRRQVHIVHITRDADYAPHDAAMLILARLIESCHREGAFDSIHYPDLPYLNPADWATHSIASNVLRAENAGFVSRLRHVANLIRYRKSKTPKVDQTAFKNMSQEPPAVSERPS